MKNIGRKKVEVYNLVDELYEKEGNKSLQDVIINKIVNFDRDRYSTAFWYLYGRFVVSERERKKLKGVI